MNLRNSRRISLVIIWIYVLLVIILLLNFKIVDNLVLNNQDVLFLILLPPLLIFLSFFMNRILMIYRIVPIQSTTQLSLRDVPIKFYDLIVIVSSMALAEYMLFIALHFSTSLITPVVMPFIFPTIPEIFAADFYKKQIMLEIQPRLHTLGYAILEDDEIDFQNADISDKPSNTLYQRFLRLSEGRRTIIVTLSVLSIWFIIQNPFLALVFTIIMYGILVYMIFNYQSIETKIRDDLNNPMMRHNMFMAGGLLLFWIMFFGLMFYFSNHLL